MTRRRHLRSLGIPPVPNHGDPAPPVAGSRHGQRGDATTHALPTVAGRLTPAIVQALDTLADSLAGLREAVGDQPGFEEIRVGSFIVKKEREQ